MENPPASDYPTGDPIALTSPNIRIPLAKISDSDKCNSMQLNGEASQAQISNSSKPEDMQNGNKETMGLNDADNNTNMSSKTDSLDATGENTNPENSRTSSNLSPLSEPQTEQLQNQISAYRKLARQEMLSDGIQLALNKSPSMTLSASESDLSSAQDVVNASSKKFTPEILGSMIRARQNRLSVVEEPKGVDPRKIYEEREAIMTSRIAARIMELEQTPVTMDQETRLKLMNELRSLRLINLQRAVRQEVLQCSRESALLQTAIHPRIYFRPKRITLSDARVTERIEYQRRQEMERKRKERHHEWLNAILAHQAELKERWRSQRALTIKVSRSVMQWYANESIRQKREYERQERERMKRLMEEDEEGYRKLIDEKKHKRLAYLLKQTDEFIDSLMAMVREHKNQMKKSKQKERMVVMEEDETTQDSMVSVPEKTVTVVEIETGKKLTGDEAPNASDLEKWLHEHPGWEALEADNDGDESSVNDVETSDNANDDDAALIIEKAKHEKDEIDDEIEKLAQEQRNYYKLAHSIQEDVKVQPTMLIGGTLKEYQISGLEWLVSLYNNNLNGILADEMGLGKTIQTIALTTYLMEMKNMPGPYLIIVPLSTMSNWVLEYDKWAPQVNKIAYKGNPQMRRSLQYRIRQRKFNVLLTTYEYIIKDKATLAKIHWKYMIIDEGHRMKNHHCKLTQILNSYYIAPHRLLLTGTPLQNKIPELWALLNFLLPSIFKSCSTFEQWFNAPFTTTGEKVELNEEESMLIIRRLHKVLRPFLLRRLKKEVESQLPDKSEYIVKCEMSALQKVLHQQMAKRGVMITASATKGKQKVSGRALMNTLMQLRKICNHPFMFEHIENACARKKGYDDGVMHDGKEVIRAAGKFEVLDRLLPKLKVSGHKVLVFCQMTQLMNILEDFCHFRNWKYLRLDGMTKSEDRGDLLAEFNKKENEIFLFMLSTRAGGLGLNLQTADTVIIFDSDWNPHQDLQAQDRAHRIGQKNEVRVLRLVTVHSVEEKILAAAQYKLGMDKKVIQAGMFNQRSTAGEREQFLQSILEGGNSDDEEDELPDDETLNQMIARTEDEFEMFTRMDMERLKEDALQVGHSSRLFSESELPEFLTEVEIEKNIAEAKKAREEVVDVGKRRAREVSYADISEAQFLKAIDEGNYEELEEYYGKDALSRKRDRDEDDSDTESQGKRKRGRPSQAKGPQAEPHVVNAMQRILDTLLKYEDEENAILSTPFKRLPAKVDLPDYYDIIEKPMDFRRMQLRLKQGLYPNYDEFAKDVELMFTNAQKYNREDSQIHEDAQTLLSYFREIKDKVLQEEEEKWKNRPATPPPAEVEEQDEKNEATETTVVEEEEEEEESSDDEFRPRNAGRRRGAKTAGELRGRRARVRGSRGARFNADGVDQDNESGSMDEQERPRSGKRGRPRGSRGVPGSRRTRGRGQNDSQTDRTDSDADSSRDSGKKSSLDAMSQSEDEKCSEDEKADVERAIVKPPEVRLVPPPPKPALIAPPVAAEPKAVEETTVKVDEPKVDEKPEPMEVQTEQVENPVAETKKEPEEAEEQPKVEPTKDETPEKETEN